MNPSISSIVRASLSIFALSGSFAYAGISGFDGKSFGGGGGGGSTIRSTPFRAAVSLREGYDDNVGASSVDEQDSFFTSLYGQLNADFNKPRTQLTLGIGGGATYYEGLEEWDYTATASIDFLHRVNSKLTLTTKLYGTYQVEPDFSLILGSERRNGQYFYGNAQFGARYQWSPRFSTVTSYSIMGIFYQDDVASRASDRTEQYFSQEFRFLLRPTTTLTAEYRFGYYDYTDNNINDGHSHFFLLGIDQAFSARLTASIRGGVEIRETNNTGSNTAPYGEATLTYAYSQLSTISWVNRYGFEQAASLNPLERKSFRSGLQIRHGFTPKLSAYLAAFYQYNEFSGFIDYSEQLFDISTGIEFKVNRNFALNMGYSYTHLSSDFAFSEYDRNRYNVGATLSF